MAKIKNLVEEIPADTLQWDPASDPSDAPTELPIGRKYDIGKPLYSLVPPNALKEIVDVLTIGADKYDPGNWMIVDQLMYRYANASERHYQDWRLGNQYDSETGKHHLAHAICCLMFMLEKELVGESWEEYVKRELQFCGHPSTSSPF